MTFERSLTGFRYAETNFGDDLQAVALRELGDANRWHELAWINNLLPPYLTDDPRRVTDRVLLTGTMIYVPAAPRQYEPSRDEDEVFLRDCVLVEGMLRDDGSGDLGIVAGRANLKQQLLHRVTTPLSQLRRHPEYGCAVYRLLGAMNGPAAAILGADYVKTALQSDFRVEEVTRSQAEVGGDAVRISAEVEAITGGKPVDLSSLGKWNPWPWDKPPVDDPPDPGAGGWGNDWSGSFGS